MSGNLSLGQSCTHNLQCTGTTHGERCFDGECFCEEGYVLQRLRCLLGKQNIYLLLNTIKHHLSYKILQETTKNFMMSTGIIYNLPCMVTADFKKMI